MRKLSKIFDSLQGSTHWRWWVEYYRYIGKSLLLSYNNDERSEKMDNKKVHKKIKWRKIKDAVVDKWLFVIMIIITFIFVISPYWLKWEVLENEVSYFLQPLKVEGYKSSYIEMLGALVGTFLAISGALWTQRRDEIKKEKQIIKEAAIIIYYDFKFAFEDIFKFENAYACIKPGTVNRYDDLAYFIKYRKSINIYLDSNWFSNVAKLCGILSADEIKQIYKIYGDLETIKSIFKQKDEEIDLSMAHRVYYLIQSDLCKLIIEPKIETLHLDINEQLMTKLNLIATGE